MAVNVANALLAEAGEVLQLLPLTAQSMQRPLKLRDLLPKAYAVGICSVSVFSSQFQPVIPVLLQLIR